MLVNFGVHAQSEKDQVWYLTTSDSVRLFVKEMGNSGGDTLVILHGGWGAEHHYLIDAFKSLADSHLLVFYDQRGSLRSPCADSLVSVSHHIRDLESLRLALGLQELDLIGHSMGTWLASAYLQKHPQRVEKMLLCALVYPKTPATDEEAALWQSQQKRSKEFMERKAIEKEIAEEELTGQELSDKEKTFKWRIQFAGTNIYHVSRWRQVKGGQVFYDQSAGTAAGKSMPGEWDFGKVYEQTGIPITIIQGSHDFADMQGLMAKAWLDDLKNVNIHIVEQAGHNAWIDQPKYFAVLLQSIFTD